MSEKDMEKNGNEEQDNVAEENENTSPEEAPQEQPPQTEEVLEATEEAPIAQPEAEVVEEVPAAEPEAEVVEEVPAAEPEAEVVEEVPAVEPEAEVVEEVPAVEPEAEVVEEVPAVEPEAEVVEEVPAAEPEAEAAEEAPAEEFKEEQEGEGELKKKTKLAYAELIIYDKKENNKRISLLNERVTIGRVDPLAQIYPDIDLTFFDSEQIVSRRHSEIYQDPPGHYYALDIGSSNGTFLNRKKIQKGVSMPLKDGDELHFAKTRAVFCQPSVEE